MISRRSFFIALSIIIIIFAFGRYYYNTRQVRKLFDAIEQNNSDKIKQLIDKKVNINAQFGGQQVTPLHKAVFAKNKAVIDLLLQAGADINAQDSLDYTPVDSVASIIIDMGELTSIYGPDWQQKRQEWQDIMRILLNKNGKSNIYSPLVLAVLASDTQKVRELLSGSLVLAYAKEIGNPEIIALLSPENK